MDEKTFLTHQASFMSNCEKLRPEFLNFYNQPCLGEDTLTSGFDTHYLYHVAWAMRKILKKPPKHHTDISSAINFAACLSAIIPTTFIDFRPADLKLTDLYCEGGDLSRSNTWEAEQFDSVSCMHVVEHIGLGRYGDELDVMADLRAITTLKKIVKPGGKLYFVVPVGKPAVFFNAHRVYQARNIIEYFSDKFELGEFYFIQGPQNLEPLTNCHFDYTLQFTYGCGCFEFTKII
jgi:SAM-dependent methyltransferase